MTLSNLQELIAIVQPDGEIVLEWGSPVPRSTASARLERRLYEAFEGGESRDWLLLLAFSSAHTELSVSVSFWQDFAGRLATKLRHIEEIEEKRDVLPLQLDDAELMRCCDAAPLVPGSEYLIPDFLRGIWETLVGLFRSGLSAFPGSVEAYVQTFNPDVHLAGRVYFHLVENNKGGRPFAFLATYSTRIAEGGVSRHVPLKLALKEFAGQRERLLDLLATVYAAARRSELISNLIESGELFHPLLWGPEDAYTFLKEVPDYEDAGVLCRIPNWWKAKASSISLNVSLGDKAPSLLGMDAMLRCNPSLMVDGVPISEAEVKRLLQESEGLAFLKNRWVTVDPEKLKQTLEAYQQARALMDEGLSLRDALRLQLTPESVFGNDGVVPDITNGEWLEGVITKLRRPAALDDVRPGPEFLATLRPYQQQGVNWLWFLHQLGFGACLADDMGLGKTIQVLAFLNVLQTREPKSTSLLVVPASLLGNWLDEAQKFYPKLRIYGAHPSLGTPSPHLKPATLTDWDLVITTYALVNRYDWLRETHWRSVIIDEAQAIKNPGTRQSKAVKELKGSMRIALTGTPIENRLGDLWSLFDFLDKGLLGNAAEFKRFIKSIGERVDGYTRLRQVITPYTLRRLKTDKSIIADLPDKVEMKTYASLSKKQIVLYRELTEELLRRLAETDGIQRRGLVLASLMKFKQICNHPDQYLGLGGFSEEESGKFERLREICETVQQKRERMLVFTQFREMTQPIHDHLERVFGRPGLILHGQVAVGKRKEVVARFQGREYVPFMVLSIKAGGVGLNLTKANHVVHFDRWWNPAVENQATDRAFRIGQQRDVLVHKFVTRGTVEERIDQMIEGKLELAEEIVTGSADNWVTELDNEKLKNMFTLSL